MGRDMTDPDTDARIAHLRAFMDTAKRAETPERAARHLRLGFAAFKAWRVAGDPPPALWVQAAQLACVECQYWRKAADIRPSAFVLATEAVERSLALLHRAKRRYWASDTEDGHRALMVLIQIAANAYASDLARRDGDRIASGHYGQMCSELLMDLCDAYEPAGGVGEGHLATVLLDELTDQPVFEVDVEGACHSPGSVARAGGRCERQPDTQGTEDREGLPKLAGRLALLEIDDEAQPGARCQGKIGLRDTQLSARGSDGFADVFGLQAHAEEFQYVPGREY